MKRAYNFGAGPAILPEEVLAEASAGVLEIGGSGMSILEVSHRSKEYEAIHMDAAERLLRILGLSADSYVALFLGGGASTQFAMVPAGFLKMGETADYVDTGSWSNKAIKEAKRFGSVNVAASSEDRRYSYIPADLSLTAGAKYLHITTNNTIEGTEWAELPQSGGAPLIADASSDIMARDRAHSRLDLIYAGAQKNAGPAGVTLVVIRKTFLESANGDVPTMMSYKTHAKANSLYNTPPVFAIYVVDLVLKWVEAQGGVKVLDGINRRKAATIYEALDQHPAFYEPAVPAVADRSVMNITFRLKNPDLESALLAGAKERSMVGLKGHRDVGGFRASIYNAFPAAGCTALATFLHEFAVANA